MASVAQELTSAVPWGYAALGSGVAPRLPCLNIFNVLYECIDPVTQHLKHHFQKALDAHSALQPCPHGLHCAGRPGFLTLTLSLT